MSGERNQPLSGADILVQCLVKNGVEAAPLAAEAGRVLAAALEKEPPPEDRTDLATGLAALAARMEPGEAVAVCRQAARLVTETLGKEESAYERRLMAARFAALAERLSPEEARQVCRAWVQAILDAPVAGHDWDALLVRALALTSLLPWLPEEEVPPLTRRLVFELYATRGSSHDVAGLQAPLLNGLDDPRKLLRDVRPPVLRPRAAGLAAAVGLSAATPFHALPALAGAAEPPPCLLSTQDLVELLKMPTCRGNARGYVLEALGNRYRRTFANHWEFVRFAQEQRLDLDFTSPARRPLLR